MNRPVIGVAAYLDRARWDIWDTQAAIVPRSYVKAIELGGGLPVVLPPSPANVELVSKLDGLVLTAGADIDPSWYGSARHPETEEPRPDRDVAEFALMRAALAADLPVLGVCRGLQLLVIEYGGTLHQHLPESHGHHHHCPRVGEPGWHAVTFVAGTRVADVLGADELANATDMVTSHHHQGVAHPGNLHVAARADDGLIEAVEDPARRFVVGVQWHPEITEDHRLFAALVAAAEQTVRSA